MTSNKVCDPQVTFFNDNYHKILPINHKIVDVVIRGSNPLIISNKFFEEK